MLPGEAVFGYSKNQRFLPLPRPHQRVHGSLALTQPASTKSSSVAYRICPYLPPAWAHDGCSSLPRSLLQAVSVDPRVARQLQMPQPDTHLIKPGSAA